MAEEEIELSHNGFPIWVRRVTIGKQFVYYIRFDQEIKPLVITVGLRANSEKFWTSVPEGRQEEAEAIGVILNKHFNSK